LNQIIDVTKAIYWFTFYNFAENRKDILHEGYHEFLDNLQEAGQMLNHKLKIDL